jgi:hypothetical protein
MGVLLSNSRDDIEVFCNIEGGLLVAIQLRR